jgi:hypothetical protein
MRWKRKRVPVPPRDHRPEAGETPRVEVPTTPAAEPQLEAFGNYGNYGGFPTARAAEQQPEHDVAVPRTLRVTGTHTQSSLVLPYRLLSPYQLLSVASGTTQAYPYGQTVTDDRLFPPEQRTPEQERAAPPAPPTQSSSPVEALLPSRWEVEAGKRRIVLED